MSIKYGYNIDLSADTTASKVIKLVGKNKKVLEFGCSYGYMSEILINEFNCQVVGVEIDEEAAIKANQICQKVIVGDVEQLVFDEVFDNQYFDVIIFADVLEHLKDPWSVLKDVSKLLTQDGFIIASLPNVAYGGVIIDLLQGKFNYRSLGILDNTHLRFFTRNSMIELFESSGYYISEIHRTIVPLQNSEFHNFDAKINKELLQFISEYNTDFETYQFVVKVNKMSDINTLKELRKNYKKVLSEIDKLSSVLLENKDLKSYVEKLEYDISQVNEYAHQLQQEFKQLQEYSYKLELDIKQVNEYARHLENDIQKYQKK